MRALYNTLIQFFCLAKFVKLRFVEVLLQENWFINLTMTHSVLSCDLSQICVSTALNDEAGLFTNLSEKFLITYSYSIMYSLLILLLARQSLMTF